MAWYRNKILKGKFLWLGLIIVVFFVFTCNRMPINLNAPLFSLPAANEKEWPSGGLRGFATPMMAPIGSNSQDPDSYLTEAVFLKMKAWNINLLRVAINVDNGSIWDVATPPPAPVGDPLAPYRKNLAGFTNLLELAAKYRIYIIPVASPLGTDNDLYEQEGGYAFNLYHIWTYVATNFGKSPWLLAYDLLNEPHTIYEAATWHNDILPKLVAKIRTVDKNTYMAVEPYPWGGPDGFLDMIPVNDKKTIYSFHFYSPGGLTSQGISGYVGTNYIGKSYPGMLQNSTEPAAYWDKAKLESVMSNVIIFQKKYNVPIWVGEFSSIRSAPGAAVWVKDCVDLFEKHKFSYTYHAYRGWSGWNPTFASNNPSWGNNSDGGDVTDRLQELIKGWNNNVYY